MREPAGLREPFRSEDERADYLAQLLDVDRRLELLRAAASLGGADLRRSAAWMYLANVRPNAGDSVELQLQRWISIFENDLATIRQARNQIVHNIWTSDYDVRAAVWLGGELFRLVTGERPKWESVS